MPDRVWPLARSEPPSLRTFNGFGTGLRGFTRVDDRGCQFATNWLMVLGFPLVPLERFYLRKVSERHTFAGASSRTVTDYQIAGESALRPDEVLLTWLYSLLAVAVVVGPSLLLLSQADRIVAAMPGLGGWAVLVLVLAFLCVLFASIALVVVVQLRYQRHWAPLRTVQWLDRKPLGDWESYTTRRDSDKDAW